MNGERPPVTSPEADTYRLLQAEELLREAGWTKNPDGTWSPPPPADQSSEVPHD